VVEVKDIVDEDSFKEWIIKRPQFELDLVVNRAALRVMPIFLFWEFVESEEKSSLTDPIRFLWQTLFSFAVTNCSNQTQPVLLPDLGRSTQRKARMIFDSPRLWSVNPIADAADFSVSAAFSSNSLPQDIILSNRALQHATETDIWAYVQSDCEDLINGISLNKKVLWHDSSNPLSAMWTEAKAQLQKEKVDWTFWIRWYDSVLAGKPLSCEMLFNILSISSKDWRKGAAHVNAIITEIEEAFLAKATPLAERMEVNPETQRLRVVPERMSQKALYNSVLEAVGDGMSDLRNSPQFDNALSALKPVFETILDRTFDKYLNSPQRVHDDFVKSRNRINRLLDVGELSPNDEVVEFADDLDKAAAHIRANMPQVKASMAALARLRMSEASENDRTAIQAGAEAVAEISEPELADEMLHDARALLFVSKEIPAGAPPVQAPDEAYRFTHRIIESKRILSDEVLSKAGKGVSGGFLGGQILNAAVEAIVRVIGL